MKVLITGSSGLIGTALSKSLTPGGHSAIRLQRQNNDPDSPVWDPENCLKDLARIGEIYAVIHLAGENIADGRWSKTKKNRILNSRVKGTKLLSEYFSNLFGNSSSGISLTEIKHTPFYKSPVFHFFLFGIIYILLSHDSYYFLISDVNRAKTK